MFSSLVVRRCLSLIRSIEPRMARAVTSCRVLIGRKSWKFTHPRRDPRFDLTFRQIYQIYVEAIRFLCSPLLLNPIFPTLQTFLTFLLTFHNSHKRHSKRPSWLQRTSTAKSNLTTALPQRTLAMLHMENESRGNLATVKRNWTASLKMPTLA